MEGSLHPPQLLLDPLCWRLAGLLQVRVALRCQQVDVTDSELRDAPPKVRLQRPVLAVREGRLPEGVDLTHNLRYVPWLRREMRQEQTEE